MIAKDYSFVGGEVRETFYFWGGGEKEHIIVRRFPGNTRSSFW
jgi:hypothetical protein